MTPSASPAEAATELEITVEYITQHGLSEIDPRDIGTENFRTAMRARPQVQNLGVEFRKMRSCRRPKAIGKMARSAAGYIAGIWSGALFDREP